MISDEKPKAATFSLFQQRHFYSVTSVMQKSEKCLFGNNSSLIQVTRLDSHITSPVMPTCAYAHRQFVTP